MFIAFRFLSSSLILTILFFSRIKTIGADTLQKGFVLGILLCLGFALQTIGLNYTTASKSGFITGTMVIFTPLLQIAIRKQLPSVGNFLGIILVTLGLFLLTTPTGSTFNLGDGLTLVCAISFAVYIVYLDGASKKGDILQLTYVQLLTTGVLSGLLAVSFEEIRFEPTDNLFLVIGYLTLFATLLTTYLQTRYQRDTTPTRAVVIFSIEPVISALLAFMILGEILGTLGVLGGAVIVVGLLISELSDSIPLLSRSFNQIKESDEESYLP